MITVGPVDMIIPMAALAYLFARLRAEPA